MPVETPSPPGVFTTRVNSADSPEPFSHILLQTAGASPKNPYQVTIAQNILTPFVGEDSKLDLVECVHNEAGTLVGSEILIATKSGFEGEDPGTLQIVKTITEDTCYRLDFVPGTAGEGEYTVSVMAPSVFIFDPDDPEYLDDNWDLQHSDYINPNDSIWGALIGIAAVAALGIIWFVATGPTVLAYPVYIGVNSGIEYYGVTYAAAVYIDGMTLTAAGTIPLEVATGLQGTAIATGGTALGPLTPGGMALIWAADTRGYNPDSVYIDRYFDHNYGIIPGEGGWWYYDANIFGGGQWRWFQSLF